jgi:hypothetical protein
MSSTSDDFDLPSSAFPDSAESDSTSSDGLDLPSYASSSSDSYDAGSFDNILADLDPLLAACYPAVFGLAAWAPADDARLFKFREFTRACFRHTWVIRTLEDFYYHSDSVLNLLRRYDFMTPYETAYTDMWARVSMEQAVSRLENLHVALRIHGGRAIQQEITALLAAHAAPAARDRAILAYLAPYAPRAAFDNVGEWYNMPADSEASEASDASSAGDADERDKENKRPTAADTSSAPPARPPPARPRRTPAPKRHVPPDHRARVPALLAALAQAAV